MQIFTAIRVRQLSATDPFYVDSLHPLFSVKKHSVFVLKYNITEIMYIEFKPVHPPRHYLDTGLLSAENGREKDSPIERTLKRCSKYSTSELVEITHRPESPWDVTPKDAPYSVITDESIKAYHKNEIDL